ncbi:MAG TPA: histidine--tRNA ligase [Candidatus Acidoferrales bacterium]
MPEKVQIRAIKGVRDILPPESGRWIRVEDAARKVFGTYGFGEIRLPEFERARLFERTVGNDTDIVTKELFTWIDSPKANRALKHIRAEAGKDAGKEIDPRLHIEEGLLREFEDGAFDSLHEQTRVCLRPEATASVVRAYIEHGMHTLPGDVKLYYMGPMFRRERPQKGRYRQFYQIGAEVLGQSDAPGIDAELIEMLFAFFGRVGLEGLSLDLNSIGCKDCRGKYVEVLRAELVKVKEKLGADSQRRIETNPLRVLDSKAPDEQAIIETLPRISDHLCEACKTHFAEVRRQLDLRGITYNLNWRLVRGLDYYMRTTFEIIAPGLGSQNAVCGGGRYDGLVELLGGLPTKGIGFAIGEDRLMLSLEAAGKLAVEPAVDAFIVWMGAATQATAIKIAQRLRGAGIKVELPPEEFKFKKALGLADKLGARYAILIGENEIAAGKFTLKRLADAVQTSVTEVELIEALKAN